MSWIESSSSKAALLSFAAGVGLLSFVACENSVSSVNTGLATRTPINADGSLCPPPTYNPDRAPIVNERAIAIWQTKEAVFALTPELNTCPTAFNFASNLTPSEPTQTPTSTPLPTRDLAIFPTLFPDYDPTKNYLEGSKKYYDCVKRLNTEMPCFMDPNYVP